MTQYKDLDWPDRPKKQEQVQADKESDTEVADEK